MRKNIGKKILVTILSASMIATMIGCGSSKSSNSSKASTEETVDPIEESKSAKLVSDKENAIKKFETMTGVDNIESLKKSIEAAKTNEELQVVVVKAETAAKTNVAKAEAKTAVAALTHIEGSAYAEKLEKATTEVEIVSIVNEAKKAEEAKLAEAASKAAEEAAKKAAEEEAARKAEEERIRIAQEEAARQAAAEEARQAAEEEARRQAEAERQAAEEEARRQAASSASYENRVLDLVNEARRNNGLSELSLRTDLCGVANTRACEMAATGEFSHDNFQARLDESGVDYWTAGENIAYGQRSADEVFDAWMNSAGHRANILTPEFKYMGLGYSTNGSGRIYWAQIFTG